MIHSLYIVGFPSLYGGAGAELYHQIKVWRQMGMEMHLIPTQKKAHCAGLYPEMMNLGVTVHEGYDWEAIPAGAPVISFCNEEFLVASPEDTKTDEKDSFRQLHDLAFRQGKGSHEAWRYFPVSLSK